ncbi:MAG: 50S ribosomal protein L6 [Syntrophales bacterium]|jgi:large subunit ribosomal protein L6|nr:50S ribosomal protein L6 [Syntrophales bacterium]
MSRIGKMAVQIPQGVKISRENELLAVEGPKGKLTYQVPGLIDVVLNEQTIEVKRRSDLRQDRSLHGLVRTLIANMVSGVSVGFQKGLEISGVGYRAEVTGKVLKLIVGYSAPVEYHIPEGIDIKVEKLVAIMVSGIDKQQVGRVASEIRGIKKPEPYKGKGIKYAGEEIKRKVGKSAAK